MNTFSKEQKLIIKIIKSSLRDATYYFGFIGNDPAGSLQIPRILSFESKKTMPNMYIQ